MNLTMRLTLDGLIRALRVKAEIAADERADEARRMEKPETAREESDERRP